MREQASGCNGVHDTILRPAYLIIIPSFPIRYCMIQTSDANFDSAKLQF